VAITRFEEIEAWQLARQLTNSIYDIWDRTDGVRDFGLKDQMTRAAGSVMHNIAEGFDSGSNAEFVRFLGYAGRSCTELQSQLYIALDRKYVTQDRFESCFEQCRRTRSKVGAFIQYLNRADAPEHRSIKPRTNGKRT
jgi:four helix bundle protein